jgi:hypothetical protein
MIAWHRKKAVGLGERIEFGVVSFLILNAFWLAALSAQSGLNGAKQALDKGQVPEAIRFLEQFQKTNSHASL